MMKIYLSPVDFRSLSVREFGTIYEGLLESELSLAEQDLIVDQNGTYLPAKLNDKISIRKGEIYFMINLEHVNLQVAIIHLISL